MWRRGRRSCGISSSPTPRSPLTRRSGSPWMPLLPSSGTSAVFLDRDGVINKGVMDEQVGDYESPFHPEDVKLEDRAVEGLRTLEELGWPLIVVSNQPAAAKGIVS